MIENSDAVSIPPSLLVPFSFRPPRSAFAAAADRPVFSFKLRAHRLVPVGQSVCPSPPAVCPPSLLPRHIGGGRGSISIDLKFSKPISCTRLQFATERKGERAAEGGGRESKVQLVLPSPMRQSRLHRRRRRRRR